MTHLPKRLFPFLLVLTIVVGSAFAAPSAAPAPSKWETIETISAELSDDRINVSVDENFIYVFVPKPTNVKVFTILGQLVSQASLPAGTSRLKVATRGIYILKAGSITRRITI